MIDYVSSDKSFQVLLPVRTNHILVSQKGIPTQHFDIVFSGVHRVNGESYNSSPYSNTLHAKCSPAKKKKQYSNCSSRRYGGIHRCQPKGFHIPTLPPLPFRPDDATTVWPGDKLMFLDTVICH